MIEVCATKYYTLRKHTNPIEAQKEIEQMKERHPDRSYTVLINKRAYYQRYTVAQVQYVTTRIPEPGKDFHWPPAPDAGNYAVRDDYRKDRREWADGLKKRMGDYEEVLTGPMNP
jgi:hypothetical protein